MARLLHAHEQRRSGPRVFLWCRAANSANCALYCGAAVDFVDIDLTTGLMSIPALEAKLATAERDGTLPDLVIPVHFAGKMTDMGALAALRDKYGFKILEDASHALGASSHDGAITGGCRYCDALVFSFHAVKAIATGEGGAVMTNNPAVADRCRMMRTHGITREPDKFVGDNREAYYYEQQILGFNYRLTDFQAVLGRSQLARLPSFIARREELARRYAGRLRDLPAHVPLPDSRSAWHLFVILVDERRTRSNADRDTVFRTLRANQIGANVHYLAVHLHPYYRARGFREGMFPASEEFARRAISLPLHQRLTESDQDRVIETLYSVCGKNS